MADVKTHTTPNGEVVGWDICGNPTCHRHISITDLDDCPKHPVTPGHLDQRTHAKSRFNKEDK
jgi:hypothetical protein